MTDGYQAEKSVIHSYAFQAIPISWTSFFFIFFTEDYDAYIIVSFVNATLVLSIGETVEEVTDSGFLGTTRTLSCSALGDDALVQVILKLCTLNIKEISV